MRNGCTDTERQITLAQASRLPQVQYNGRGPNIATIWRWSVKGVRGIKLETWMVGMRKVTTIAAVERFIDRLSNPTEPKTPVKVLGAHRAAEIELEAAGV